MKLIKGIGRTILALVFTIASAVNAANKITGDYNGDGNQDAFNQAINRGETSSLTPEVGSLIVSFHKSWIAAHPDIPQISDWSVENYGAFSANLNASPGDELLLLGKKKIILIHGDIITPILLPKDVQNAIISWDASGLATYTFFDLDADPSQFNVLFGDFDGDGYQEIFLQGKNLGSTSYILNSDGSINQTLTSGSLGMDWSGDSFTLVIQDINGDGIDDIQAFSNIAEQGNQFVFMSNGIIDYVDVGYNQASSPVTASLAGSTGGQFRVNESGAATYSIPIAVPTGTAGVAPQLSLNYSSNGGNGPLGIGWSLSGMSAVSRCGMNMAQNGLISGITNTSTDRFCMDGQQLFSDGIYGANGSNYYTETYNNTEISSYGGSAESGPTEWRIKTRSGDIHYYGKVGASENALVKTENGVINRLWLLRKTQDLAGNTIEYDYGKAANNSEMFIKNITYGGNVNANTSYHSKVQFVYADEIDVNFVRPDMSSGYSAGSAIAQTKLLKQIRTYSDNKHVKTLQIFHEISNSKLLRIKAIQECSYLNNCLKEISFEWSDVDVGFNQVSSFGDGATRLDEDYMLAVDIDGDGMSDVMYLDDWADKGSNGNAERNVYINFSPYGTALNSYHKMSAVEFASIQLIDYNSDGIMDIIYEDEQQNKLKLMHWNAPLQKLTGVILDLDVTGDEMAIVDLDGDAKMDLLRVEEGLTYWYRNTGLTSSTTCVDYGDRIGDLCTTKWSFTAAKIEVGIDIPSLTISNDIIPFEPNFVGISKWVDLNGDGISDLISKVKERFGDDPGRYTYSYSYYGLVFDPNTNKFKSFGKIIGDYPNMPFIYPMDVNGDGLTDVVYAHGVGTNWRYKLSKGAGFTDSFDTGIPSHSTNLDDNNRNLILDYNHDGYADFFVFKKNLIGTGTYEAYSLKNNETVLLGSVSGMIQDKPKILVGNFSSTSPGQELFSYRKNYGWYKYRSNLLEYEVGSFSTQPGVINAIVGSTGVRSKILYSALADISIYTNTADKPTSPEIQLTPYIHVVKQVISETGSLDSSNNEQTVSVSYKYEDFRVHTQGRGQLGFKKLISIDDQTGIQTITEYKQEFPFVGMPLSTTRRLSDSTIISTAINDWKTKTYFGRTFPYLDSSVEKSWSLDSDGTPDDLTDNPTRFINQVITTNTYEPDGNNYGNITATSVLNTTSEANGGAGGSEWFSTSTTNSYGTSTYEKKYARLDSVTVTKSRSDVSGSHTQTSEFEYYPANYSHNGSNADGYAGMLKKETIFQGYNKQVNKIHQFDIFGNKTIEIVEAKKRNASTLAFDSVFSQRKSETTFTSNGRLVDSIINDLGYEKTFTYDTRFNGVLTATDANGLTVSYDYDELGVKYHTQAADGTYSRQYLYLCSIGGATCPTKGVYYSESHAYASDGSNLSGYARTFYNKMGQEIVKEGQTFANKKLISRIVYDKYGRVSKGYLPVFGSVNTVGTEYTDATYDALGRLIAQTEPGNRITTRQYFGTTTININAIGQSTTETKNINGELGKVKDNNNKEMTYLYDTRGNFVKLIDSANNNVEMIYDTVGHKVETRDPDKGTWKYKFNGFGELVQQIDARGVAIIQEYDVIGRMIKRIDNASISGSTPIANIDTQTTCWTYDTAAFGTTGGLLKGQLHKVRLFAGAIDCANTGSLIPLQEKIAGFDNLARTESSTQKILSKSGTQVDTYLTMSTFEESSSRVLYTILPREVTVKNHYDDFGNLTKITDAVDETILYREVTNIDKFGNVSEETYGNGVKAIKYYNAQTGYMQSVTAGAGSIGNEILDFTQYFDGIGNVTQRNDNIIDLYERFGYAEGGSTNLLNRISSFDTSSSKDFSVIICKKSPCKPIQNFTNQKTYTYDALGNLKSKSDMGDDYKYGAGGAGIHALTSIRSGGNLLRTFTYDANGNMTSDVDSVNSNSNRTIKYGAFEKPTFIQKGASNPSQITFRYGSSRERYRRIDNVYEGGTPVTIETTYLGGYEKVVHTGGAKDGTTEHKYMLGGVALKIDTEKTGQAATTKTRYLHKDHLGSVVAITDEAGIERARFRYDPFGKQHSVVNQSAINQMPVTAWLEDTQRGFTGHEMLSSVDIIHMNGRIYDANIGRFMQADAYIQAPKNMQSMNRYSYVLNNPLSYTDPSGHFFKGLKKYWRSIAAIAITIACWGNCAPVVAGFLVGAVQTGSLKGAIVGAFSAGIFQGIGDAFGKLSQANFNAEVASWEGFGLSKESANFWANMKDAGALTTTQQVGKVLAHGIAGGAMSRLNGGKFGNGFLSAGVTQAFSKSIDGIGGGKPSFSGQRIFSAAMLGGVTSAATGGKFANGAITAAFSRAFNDERHNWFSDNYETGMKYIEQMTFTLGAGVAGGVPDFLREPLGIPLETPDFSVDVALVLQPWWHKDGLNLGVAFSPGATKSIGFQFKGKFFVGMELGSIKQMAGENISFGIQGIGAGGEVSNNGFQLNRGLGLQGHVTVSQTVTYSVRNFEYYKKPCESVCFIE